MLKYRVLSGAALVLAYLLAGFFMPSIGIWFLLVAVCALGQREFYTLLMRGGIPVYPYLGMLSGAAMISATFFATCGDLSPASPPYRWENVVLLITVTAVFLRQFPQKHNAKPLETLGCTLLGILYVPYFLNYITRLAFAWEPRPLLEPLGETGRTLVFYFIMVTKAADIGAYFVGSRFGRHKLFPRISPAKSWEGLAGGIAASILTSYCFYVFGDGHLGTLPLHLHDVLALGLLLAIAGVVGDLFESMIKRSTGMKDSSSAIPGMGGLLDVLDSLLFGAPVMYLYASVFL